MGVGFFFFSLLLVEVALEKSALGWQRASYNKVSFPTPCLGSDFFFFLRYSLNLFCCFLSGFFLFAVPKFEARDEKVGKSDAAL
jgi:hypothetical protein